MLSNCNYSFLKRTYFKQKMRFVLTILFLLSSLFISLSWADTYKTNQVFLSENFSGNIPSTKVVWLRGDVKKQVHDILAHPYGKLRVKYWYESGKSVWILNEIGKEQPITVGIVVNNNQVSKIEILAFRESRGWEVKYPFFLKQFLGATLKGNNQLDKSIDGITGATLSVRAVSKLSRMALLLHKIEMQRIQS